MVLDISKLENALESPWYRETTVNKMVILETMVSKHSVELMMYVQSASATTDTNLITQQLSSGSSTR